MAGMYIEKYDPEEGVGGFGQCHLVGKYLMAREEIRKKKAKRGKKRKLK